MADFALAPGEAIALAAFLEEHGGKLPHLVELADRLRTWARAELTPAAEPEQPPTDRAWLETEFIRETPKARRAAGEAKR